jgi:hypothetical protein
MYGSKLNEVYPYFPHKIIVPSSFGEDFKEQTNRLLSLKEVINSSICLQSFICNSSNSKSD